MLETCVSITFSYFQKQTVPESFLNNVPESLNRKLGHSTTLEFLKCIKFCAPYYQFQFDFKCKTFCGSYVTGNRFREE